MNISKIFQYITINNIKKGTRYLFKNGLGAVINKTKSTIKSQQDYDAWMKQHRVTETELEQQRQHMFEYQPKISILVPTYKTPISMLHEMMASVIGQSYTNWELCIADGTMEDGELKAVLQEYVEKDTRIKVRFLDSNDGISGNTNKALELATGDFIALLDHDDTLELDALFEIVRVLQDRTVDLVYTDEDKVSEDLSAFRDANMKPDFSIDLLRSHNYITHFLVVKKSIVDEVGAFRSKYDGAQDYDFVLRCSEKAQHIEHVAKPLYHWRMSAGSTAENPESKLYCYEAGRAAVESHLERCGIKAKVELLGAPLWGLNHVTYEVTEKPLVSIIIVNDGQTKELDKTITSIQEKSTYQNIEFVVIEQSSTNEKAVTYYNALQAKHNNLKVCYWDKEPNDSLMKNYGVQNANGEYLLFLHHSMEILKPTAIEELLGVCQRTDVGAVGAKLLYPNKTIYHAGIVIGFENYAKYAFQGIGHYDTGYMMRLPVNCNYSAVAGECLMTKREVWEAVDGYSVEFEGVGNDMDYCLKIREKEWLVVYNAFSEWCFYGEKPTATESDRVKFQMKWSAVMDKGDPFYNKNFSLTKSLFVL